MSQNAQPPNEHPTAQKLFQTVPLVRRFVTSTSGQSTQEWVPVNRPLPAHNAVELADRSVVAAIRVDPANMSTKTASQWEDRIKQLDEALSTTVDFEIEQYSTLRSLDKQSYREDYHEMAAERPDEKDLTGMNRLQRRLLDERVEIIDDDHESVLVREHYILVKVMPVELSESWDDAAGLFGSATNLPLIGDQIKARRMNNYGDDLEQLRTDLTARLNKRVESVVQALGSVDGITGTPISLVEFTRLLRSYYRADNAATIPDETIRALIHDSPVVGANADVDADYEVDVQTKDSDPIAESYRSFLAPESVRYDDQRYLVLDEETYVLGLWVENWPENPDIGMFRDVLNTPGVHITLSTHALGVSKSDARQQSQKNKIKHKSDYEKKEQEGHWGAESAYRKWQAASDIEDSLTESGSGLFMTSTYVSLRASSEEQLLDAAKTMKQRFKEQPARCEVVPAHFQQEEMTHSAAPLVYDSMNKATPMLGRALAKQMPYTSNNIYEPSGIEVGIHHDRDEPTIVDPYLRGMGYNMMVFGKIGSGKSTTSKKILTQLKERNPEMNVVLIDPLEGLAGPSKLFDAEQIVVGGETGLNPLEIKETPEEKLSVVGRTTPFSEAMERFISFVETFYDLEGRELEAEKKNVWEKAGRRAYNEKGITKDPSTHGNESPTLRDAIQEIAHIAGVGDNPDIHQMGDLLDADLSETDVPLRTREAAERVLSEDIEAFRTRYRHFTKETGFDLNADGGSFYLDLQLKEGKGETGLMLGLLLTSVYEMAKESDDPTMILIDEAQYLTKHADNLTFLEQVVRHSRHYDLSLLFSTQSISEFYAKDDEGTSALKSQAEVIFNNSSMMCFHHLDDMTPEFGSEIGLNAEEATFVNSALPGDKDRGYSEMLLAVDEDGTRECYPQRVEMSMDVNPVEFSIVDYEPSDHGNWHEYLERQLGDRFDDGQQSGDESESEPETHRSVVAADGGEQE